MVPEKHAGGTQHPVVGNLATAGPPPVSRHPFFGAVDHLTDEGYHQSGPISVGKAVISMGVIDEKLFTRECITTSLLALDARRHIVSFATCDDCLQHMGSHDLILIMHARPWEIGLIITNNSFHSKSCST